MEIPIEEPSEAVPRRSEQQRQPLVFYGIRVNQCSEKSSEPATIEEATACSEKSQWMQAMETEMKITRTKCVGACAGKQLEASGCTK